MHTGGDSKVFVKGFFFVCPEFLPWNQQCQLCLLCPWILDAVRLPDTFKIILLLPPAPPKTLFSSTWFGHPWNSCRCLTHQSESLRSSKLSVSLHFGPAPIEDEVLSLLLEEKNEDWMFLCEQKRLTWHYCSSLTFNNKISSLQLNLLLYCFNFNFYLHLKNTKNMFNRVNWNFISLWAVRLFFVPMFVSVLICFIQISKLIRNKCNPQTRPFLCQSFFSLFHQCRSSSSSL